MFYVYDIHGLRFEGRMEELERARKVEQISASEAISKLGQDHTPSTQHAFQNATQNATQGESNHNTEQTVALDAYKKSISNRGVMDPLVHVYQIMSTPVQTIQQDILLPEAWDLIHQKGIRHLPVMNERYQILGVISDRDILRKITVLKDKVEHSSSLNVLQIIRRHAITTDPMSDIRRVARIMALYHTGCMPVVEKSGKLVGMVTRGDILRAFATIPTLNLYG
jgi:acetoin utilization protein AcuB